MSNIIDLDKARERSQGLPTIDVDHLQEASIEELQAAVAYVKDARLMAANIVRMLQLAEHGWPMGMIPYHLEQTRIAEAHLRQLGRTYLRLCKSLRLRIARNTETEE